MLHVRKTRYFTIELQNVIGVMMGNNLYDRAKVIDFIKIAKLDREAWKLNANAEYIPDGEHAWRLWIEHALVFAAKHNRSIIGAILAFPCMAGQWCVHKVFVKASYRGQGVGTSLFELLLRETDRINVDCFLTVDPINQSALKLYTKWGFTEKKFVQGYYRQNENRYVLTRRANDHSLG